MKDIFLKYHLNKYPLMNHIDIIKLIYQEVMGPNHIIKSKELALEYIKSNDKLVLNNEKEIDFRLYINKYRRNNQWLEDLIKRDIKERSDINDSIL